MARRPQTYNKPPVVKQAGRPVKRVSEWHGLYTAKRWKDLRVQLLARSPICADCNSLASEVDHILPHRGDLARFYDTNNLQTLCKPCHSRKTALEDGRWGKVAERPKRLKRSAVPVTYVVGCPGSGRLEIAERLAGERGLVIAKQKNMKALADLSAEEAERGAGLIRLAQIKKLAYANVKDISHAVLVLDEAGAAARRWWFENLAYGQVYVSPRGPHECVQVLVQSGRASEDEATKMVARFFSRFSQANGDKIATFP